MYIPIPHAVTAFVLLGTALVRISSSNASLTGSLNLELLHAEVSILINNKSVARVDTMKIACNNAVL